MASIDLYAPQFWWFVAACFVVLVPQTDASIRKWSFAGLNLLFLALHIEPGRMQAFPILLAALVVAWVMFRLVSRPGVSRWVAVVGGLVALGLFAIHKLPHLAIRIGASQTESVLAAVGFSYVALRLVEVTRAVLDQRQAPPDLPSTINYLLPFHMISAGPIQSYDDFVAQPGIPPALTASRALRGIERISLGLFKKFILANYIDRLFLTGFQAPMPYFFLEVQLNYIWLFLDFSAYSDVAVGLGTILGITTPENFDRPYLARNAFEYWERWHISLSQFIRRNVFIPLQLILMRSTEGRAPLAMSSVALTVTFVLCGLWHGVSWPWVGWGLGQASGLVACTYYKAWLQKRLGRKGVKEYMANPWIRVVSIVLTFEFAAAVVAIATYPYGEIHWWTNYPE